MSDPVHKLFLERGTYRRRRMRDLARMLPIIGLVLMLVPILWTPGDGGPRTTVAMLWLFGVWGALVAGAGWLTRNEAGPGGTENDGTTQRNVEPVRPGGSG